MPSLLIPALTALSGGLLFRDYKRRRLQSPEDRYMALYGHEDWGSNNMDIRVHFDPALDEEVKASWQRRLETRLPLEDSILSEIAEVEGDELVFHKVSTTVQDLLSPRQGIWFDMSQPWSHSHYLEPLTSRWCGTVERGCGRCTMKTPPLIPFRSVSAPPPIVPELMGIPQMAKRNDARLIAQGD